MHKIVDGLLRENEGRRVPVTLFTKGGGQWLEAMAATGCDALGLDWTTDIADARRRVGDKVALQGNMDPSMLYASPARIAEEVETILAGFGHGNGHVFNSGPRHPSGCAAGARRRLRRGGTRALGEIPPLRIRCDRYGGPARRTAAARG